jgi:hypothetical protein
MGIFGMFSISGIRKTVYTLFGALVLTTLWVTSLTIISARPAATSLLTEAGANVLNPFLAAHEVGVTPSGYATLEQAAKAHPTQALDLSFFKVRVLGKEIAGLSYDAGVRAIYSHVASTYYDGGPSAVFSLPADVQQAIPNFGFFGGAITTPQLAPGISSPVQLPNFLQPFFTITGFTPDSLTYVGHQRIASLLLWFWVATLVLGALTLLLDRQEDKLMTLAASIAHGAWPVILVLGGAWIFSLIKPEAFAPYKAVYGLVAGAFLPIYGVAFALGLASWAILKVLSARHPQSAAATSGLTDRQQEIASLIAARMAQNAPAPTAQPMYAPPRPDQPLGQQPTLGSGPEGPSTPGLS